MSGDDKIVSQPLATFFPTKRLGFCLLKGHFLKELPRNLQKQ